MGFFGDPAGRATDPSPAGLPQPDAAAEEPIPRWPRLRLDGLAPRVAAYLSLALLPLGLIALYQTREFHQETEARAELSLLALTEQGTAGVEQVLKEALDDKAGQEILATLLEVLEAGFVHVDVGTPQEMWVWPYFAHVPLDTLTPAQKVELFRIVTSFDYEQMRQVDAYIFYRVGIGPDGTWHHFVAGE